MQRTKAIPFKMLGDLSDGDRYAEIPRADGNQRTTPLSGIQVREEYLNNGQMLPDWFTRLEVAESYPPRHKQGFCV